MSRYAILQGNVVTQVVLWDGKSGWTPPEGHTAVEIPDDLFVEARGTLDAKTLKFVRAVPPVVTPEQLATVAPRAGDPDRMNALLQVLAEKGTIAPDDVNRIERGRA